MNRWAYFLLFLGHGPEVRILRQGGAHKAVPNKTKHLHFTFYFYQLSLTAQNTPALNPQACQSILRRFPGRKCKPCGRECPKQPTQMAKEKECVRKKKSLSCFCWIKGTETRYFRKQAHWENSLSKCNKGRLPTNIQTSTAKSEVPYFILIPCIWTSCQGICCIRETSSVCALFLLHLLVLGAQWLPLFKYHQWGVLWTKGSLHLWVSPAVMSTLCGQSYQSLLLLGCRRALVSFLGSGARKSGSQICLLSICY